MTPEALRFVSAEKLAAAFTEWTRRKNENPDNFASDDEYDSVEAVGAACAEYLLEIVAELSA